MKQYLRPEDTSLFWPPRLSLVLVVCLGTLFSLAAALVIRQWESANVEKTFLLAAEERAKTVRGAFDTQLAMMEIVRSSLVADGRIDRREFADVLKPFLEKAGAIAAVEWVPRVSAKQRADYEAAAQRDGLQGFQICERDASGQFVPAAAREEYFPIYFNGPDRDGNVPYGYDLSSEPMRATALKTARDTGKPTISGRISFVEEKQSSGGFLLCLPVFEKDKPTATTANRRQYLTGFIVGVFRPYDMVAAALQGIRPEGIDFGLYDPSARSLEDSLFYHASRLQEDLAQPLPAKRVLEPSGVKYTLQLGRAGSPWTIVCAPSATFAASHRSWWSWSVFIAGLLLTILVAGYLVLGLRNEARLEARVEQQTADIRSTQQELLFRLAAASQWCDDETPEHLRRVGLLSEALARRADWLDDDAEAIRQAAPMHDIGKIGIPDAIRHKTDPLTDEEQEVLQNHTRIGAEILAGSNVPLIKMAREIAFGHHERWDGKGYPRGLSGKSIPESARIVAIVDAFDTLTHVTPEREPLAEEDVLSILQEGVGKQFDPALMAVFLRHLPEFGGLADRYPDRRRSNTNVLQATNA